MAKDSIVTLYEVKWGFNNIPQLNSAEFKVGRLYYVAVDAKGKSFRTTDGLGRIHMRMNTSVHLTAESAIDQKLRVNDSNILSLKSQIEKAELYKTQLEELKANVQN